MLQFWKKNGSKESSKSNPPSPIRSPCSPESPTQVNGGFSLSNGSECPTSLLHLDDDDSNQSDVDWLQHSRSRLSMSLAEVIADKGALGYFIQYLEAQSAGALIRFYLDVECFRSAALEDARTSQSHSVHKNCRSELKVYLGLNCDNQNSSANSGENLEQTLSKTKDNDIQTDSDICESASVNSDAVRIFEKYIGLNAPLPVPVGEDIRNSIALALCHQGTLDSECFTSAQNVCFQIMEEEYFNEFLRSDFFCKHQIDVLTSCDVGLMDILHNHTALSYFMEFLEQEGGRAYLEFWLAAHNFPGQSQGDVSSSRVEQTQSDAIVLYEKYFSLQATCPLGFSDRIRVEIEQNICNENGPPPTCFSRPLKIVLRFLHETYFRPFLQSQLYFKYLSELVNTIQATKTCGSDCGSEAGDKLIQNTNTLLAGADASLSRKIFRNMERQNLSIDSRHLYDPDSLWRRRHDGGLSFGRVNELGRFETEVEPEPDKKCESRITRAMKKLVHMDEDKAKEEMAWQIAEMIVKDVTSLTLSDGS